MLFGFKSLLITLSAGCLVVSACSTGASPTTDDRCTAVHDCCASLSPAAREVCEQQLSSARAQSSSQDACGILLEGYHASGLCHGASTGGGGAGAEGGGAEVGGGGSNGAQPAICERYVHCATAATPAAAASILAAYGPSGTCWQSTTAVASDCIAGCEAGIRQLHDVLPSACPLCVSDAECGGATPACNVAAGECVACTADAHCPGGACDAAENKCVGCNADQHCPQALPACDAATHACVECTTNAHCPSSAPACDTSAQLCTLCQRDADCGAGLHACIVGVDPGASWCVECTEDSQCTSPGREHCQLQTFLPTPKDNTCVECVSDDHCTSAGRPYCLLSIFFPSPEDNTCVACTSDSDCLTGQACDDTTHSCRD